MRPGLVILAALAASACATHHQARGLVLRVDRDTRMVTVSHEQVPGFMDAMVMPFELRDPSELTDLVAGDRIAFFELAEAREKIIPAQAPFLDRLAKLFE